ncbi:cytochrome P450 [Phlebopus sp. FC_14]|nr:cytochrome P450 [Phlebopus sp. FC_14]
MTWMILLDVCIAIITLYLLGQLLSMKHSHSLPPGPPRWPIIGNILDVPSQNAWLTFASFGKKYGEISSMNVLGTKIIILNSAKSVADILDKKGAISSDRPRLIMSDLCGWGDSVPSMQNDERFRQSRKIFHRALGSKNAISSYHAVEEEEARRFLCNMMKHPEDLGHHIRKAAGATILKISHGYSVQQTEGNDPFVDLVDRAAANFSLVASPGTFIVDFMPFLRHLPEWFPGAGFLKDAKVYRQLVLEAVKRPYQFVVDQMVGLLSITVSTLQAFFLAMTIHPEVQKKARAELDAVVGTERLPTFEDRPSLPYINALCTEVFRWHNVVPLGVPHVTSQDDVYNGFLVPKGSTIVPNIWGILHNEIMYPDPYTFNPERFLGEKVQPDPRNHCMYLADASTFIFVATSLAVLDILRHVENGVEIVPKLEPTDGVASRPRPFKCRITPRSAKAQILVSV